MIDLIFILGGEYLLIRITDKSIYFKDNNNFSRWATIEGLKLSKVGIMKEFPDLKDRDDWKEEGIKRFKEKINNMESEEKIAEYLIKDLKDYGYKAMFKQKNGFRKEKLI